MLTCQNCGEPLTETASVCPDCGTTRRNPEEAKTDGGTSSPQHSETQETNPERTGTGEVATDETSDSTLATHEKIVYTGAALTAIGAFLPWATVLGVSVTGIEGDGILTLLIGLVTAGAVWWRPWGRRTQIGTLVAGVLVLLIGFASFTNVAAIGLYLTLFGGVALAAAGARELV